MTYEGTKHTEGEWDKVVHKGMYAKVNGELYPVALLVAPEKADEYVAEMKRLQAVKDAASTAIWKYQTENYIIARNT